jgi:Na+-driven multidrug efflux pump
MFPLFGASALTMQIGASILLIMAISIPFRSFNFCVIVGVLRGGGDVKAGMVLDLIGMYLVALPLAAVTGLWLHASVTVVYLMMCAEEFVKFFLGVWRFRQKKWLQNVTREMN